MWSSTGSRCRFILQQQAIFLLTKHFPRLDGTTYNMNALILSQGSRVCTSAVVKSEAEVKHKMKHLHNTTQDSTPQTAKIPDHC